MLASSLPCRLFSAPLLISPSPPQISSRASLTPSYLFISSWLPLVSLVSCSLPPPPFISPSPLFISAPCSSRHLSLKAPLCLFPPLHVSISPCLPQVSLVGYSLLLRPLLISPCLPLVSLVSYSLPSPLLISHLSLLASSLSCRLLFTPYSPLNHLLKATLFFSDHF